VLIIFVSEMADTAFAAPGNEETEMKTSQTKPVVMVRHAQSEWNRQGRFTGWADPPLTEAGETEAIRAGRALDKGGFRFDHVFTSRLRRAQHTARLILEHSGHGAAGIAADWRLNERHYGDLQGRDRQEVIRQVGEAQVWRWRRGYEDRPPGMAAGNPAHPAIQAQWSDIARELIPNGESLAVTRRRVMGFWDERIAPLVADGQQVLIASHGNTLRALLMGLSGMSVSEVESFEIPTGVPIIADIADDGRLRRWYYLAADADRAA
jgi:2,3-bisphosphoglycerate-dependent phosphoglycerate mutase